MGLLARRRSRAIWTDPVRRYRTLQSFSETEEDGGKDLLAAAARVTDPDLRTHLLVHAKDEARHAELFRRRAAEVRDEAGAAAGERTGSERVFDLGRNRDGEIDAHGFFSASMFDDMGEVAYVAMLNVAEQKAASLFQLHHDLTQHDLGTRAVFAEILKDEKYHVSYTGKFLERWRSEGRGREVDEGLKAARSSRFMGAWKRLGLRCGAGLSRGLFRVMFWTVVVPFGLLAGRQHPAPGWHGPSGSDGDTRGQY